jgi:hypothetical protein
MLLLVWTATMTMLSQPCARSRPMSLRTTNLFMTEDHVDDSASAASMDAAAVPPPRQSLDDMLAVAGIGGGGMTSSEASHRAGFVSILGVPNVGKSTLMNALLGERLSIVTSRAQTTRHRIMGILNGDDYQIVYSDTPGVVRCRHAPARDP